MTDIFHHPLAVRLAFVAVILVGIIAFVPGLSTLPPMDRDESRFAQASKQMVESGDLVTVRYQQELRAKKPVGIYWMQAASARLLGEDRISSYRLPSLLGAMIVALASFGFARQLMPFRQALIAGIFMASSLTLVAEAHLAKTDAMLCAAILVQQIALWRIYDQGLSGDYVSGKLAMVFWAAMGLAILIKGPIAPLIAALTVAVLTLRERSWRWMYFLRPVLGFIVLTVMVLPWVILVTHATDGVFLATAIKGDLVSKIQSGQESHGAPPLTHLALLVLTFWPGSLLLMRGIMEVLKRRRDREVIFLLGWVLPFWMVIELTPPKLPHYILPVMPALAMLMAYGIEFRMPPKRRSVTAPDGSPQRARIFPWLRGLDAMRLLVIGWNGVFMLASVSLGVVVLYAASDLGGSREWGLTAFILSVMVAGLAYWWGRVQKLAILLLIAVTASGFHAAVFGGVLPSLSDMHIAPRLKSAIASLEEPVDSIAVAGYHEPSMVFSLGTDTLLFSAPEVALFLAEAPNGLAIVEKRAEAEFLKTAATAGIAVSQAGQVNGYNASRGKRVELEFYRAAD